MEGRLSWNHIKREGGRDRERLRGERVGYHAE